MTSLPSLRPTGEAPSDAATIFQQEWRIYRKMVEGDYLFHSAAYAALRRVLIEEAPQPFRFLDLACGDASASAAALAGTGIARYWGVDLSEAALALARDPLGSLSCSVSLRKGEFQAELTGSEIDDRQRRQEGHILKRTGTEHGPLYLVQERAAHGAADVGPCSPFETPNYFLSLYFTTA